MVGFFITHYLQKFCTKRSASNRDKIEYFCYCFDMYPVVNFGNNSYGIGYKITLPKSTTGWKTSKFGQEKWWVTNS